MASTSVGMSPSILLLMLIFLLLFLVHIRVFFRFAIQTFGTHVIMGSLVSGAMHHFFVEANTCMFAGSVMHTVVCGLGAIGCSIISSLGLVPSLLWKEKD